MWYPGLALSITKMSGIDDDLLIIKGVVRVVAEIVLQWVLSHSFLAYKPQLVYLWISSSV